MPEWVTHMMVADKVLEEFPQLDRHGFFVGNVAPDCNIQNEDWTVFTPSREVTHWMQGERKAVADVDAFCVKYIVNRKQEVLSRDEQKRASCRDEKEVVSKSKFGEEYSFLLGYYVHLIADAVFQEMIRDKERVAAVWKRIKADEELMEKLRKMVGGDFKIADPNANSQSLQMEENWDMVKRLIPREERMREMHSLEAEYLNEHPNSGYFTDIMPLKEFPDYIDYLPHGSIAFKIPYLGSYIPEVYEKAKFVGWSREEFAEFLEKTICLVKLKFQELDLV